MNETERLSTAQLVARLRERRALTQEGLARELGVAFSTVNAWEAGRSQPQARHRRRLQELAAEAFAGAPALRVLLVDDDATDLRVATRAVTAAAAELELPVEITTETDPLRALLQLGAARPALTIVDVFMPGLDGFELADRMAELDGFARHRLVLVTAGRDAAIDRAAARRGLLVLDKPLVPDVLGPLLADTLSALSEPLGA